MGLRDRLAMRRGRRRDDVAADGDATETRRRRPGIGRRAGVGASRGLTLLASLVDTIVLIVAVIIVAAILFVVFEANKDNSIVSHLSDWAKTLVGPFDGLFTPKDKKLEIAVNYGIALAVYVIVGRFVASLLRRTGPA